MPAPEFPRDAKAAIALQRQLAGLVQLTPLARLAELVAGVDCAIAPGGEEIVGVAVLMRFSTGEVVEEQVARRPLTFPYVPGLLSFREGPVLLAALAALTQRPEMLLCDGQGIAHPRRFGIASHLGVLLDLPSVGIGKSRLCGEERVVGEQRGDWEPLMDKGICIGSILRTRERVRPVYVSPGHRCDQAGARAVVLAWGRGHRLPEPVHLADRLSKRRRGAPLP